MKTPADPVLYSNNPPLGTIGFNHPDLGTGSGAGGLYFGWIPGITPQTMMKGHYQFTTTDSIEYEVLISYKSTRFTTGVNSAADWEDIDVFYKKDSSEWIEQAESGHSYSLDGITQASSHANARDQAIYFNTTAAPIGISDIKLWNNRMVPGDL